MEVSLEESFFEKNIPSNYVRIIGRELCLSISDFSKLLAFTQLSTDEIMQEDTLVNAYQLIQILGNASLLAHDRNLGLRLGKRLTPATHGLMGFVVNNSPNLIGVLEAFQNFMPTRIIFGRVSLKQEYDFIKCELNFLITLPLDVKRLLSEICMVILYESIEFIIGRKPHEVKILFEHASPTDLDLYHHIFNATINFASTQTAMHIPYHICQITNPSADKNIYRLALEQCEKLIKQLKSEKDSYTNKVQQIVLSNPSKTITEEFIASELFISKRTLARKLKIEGTRYQSIIDDVRSRQAIEYLKEDSLSIAAIASLLNFHDSTNFRRAFKRWFKLTPSEYRSRIIKINDR